MEDHADVVVGSRNSRLQYACENLRTLQLAGMGGICSEAWCAMPMS
jgi:hypothetical protein